MCARACVCVWQRKAGYDFCYDATTFQSAKWFCAVRYEPALGTNTIVKMTTDLYEARDSLGLGSFYEQQMIVLMTGTKGDLKASTKMPRTWQGGGMSWSSEANVKRMVGACSAVNIGTLIPFLKAQPSGEVTAAQCSSPECVLCAGLSEEAKATDAMLSGFGAARISARSNTAATGVMQQDLVRASFASSLVHPSADPGPHAANATSDVAGGLPEFEAHTLMVLPQITGVHPRVSGKNGGNRVTIKGTGFDARSTQMDKVVVELAGAPCTADLARDADLDDGLGDDEFVCIVGRNPHAPAKQQYNAGVGVVVKRWAVGGLAGFRGNWSSPPDHQEVQIDNLNIGLPTPAYSCRGGILSKEQTACCHRACGSCTEDVEAWPSNETCGDRGVAAGSECCPTALVAARRPCVNETDVACSISLAGHAVEARGVFYPPVSAEYSFWAQGAASTSVFIKPLNSTAEFDCTESQYAAELVPYSKPQTANRRTSSGGLFDYASFATRTHRVGSRCVRRSTQHRDIVAIHQHNPLCACVRACRHAHYCRHGWAAATPTPPCPGPKTCVVDSPTPYPTPLLCRVPCAARASRGGEAHGMVVPVSPARLRTPNLCTNHDGRGDSLHVLPCV